MTNPVAKNPRILAGVVEKAMGPALGKIDGPEKTDAADKAYAPAAAAGAPGGAAGTWAAKGATVRKTASPLPVPDTEFDGYLIGSNGCQLPPGTPLDTIAKVMPSNGKAEGLGVYINGINVTAGEQIHGIQELADVSGRPMIGVHNGSAGVVADVGRAVSEKLGMGGNERATAQLTETILTALDKGQPLSLFAHSQGALVLASALLAAQDALMKKGMTRPQAEDAMSEIQVETFATAASRFPDGPQYVHYLNDADPVAKWFGTDIDASKVDHTNALDVALRAMGVNAKTGDALATLFATQHPGRGAVVIHFSDDGKTAAPNLSMPTHRLATYLAHRLPFSVARERSISMGASARFWNMA